MARVVPAGENCGLWVGGGLWRATAIGVAGVFKIFSFTADASCDLPAHQHTAPQGPPKPGNLYAGFVGIHCTP